MALKGFPEIKLFPKPPSPVIRSHFEQIVRLTLNKIFPDDFVQDQPGDGVEAREQFEEQLPFFAHSSLTQNDMENVSFYLVCKSREGGMKFLYQMIHNWLVPEQPLRIWAQCGLDFGVPAYGEERYSLLEVAAAIDTVEQLETIRRQLPAFRTEIVLGARSEANAQRIMEVRGMSENEKTAMVQEQLSYLIHRHSGRFDANLLSEMQHFLVRCPNDFKRTRAARHMCRLIATYYLFRKDLREKIAADPSRRYVNVRMVRGRMLASATEFRRLAIVVGLNFLRNTEVFEERHLLVAVRTYVPSAVPIEGSFVLDKRTGESICTAYLELEREDGRPFSSEEVARLRRELPNDLKARIQQLMHPVFMPRNDEEIMRNIMSLAGQLKYLRDLPQVMISFDEQTGNNLVFTVILLRVLKSDGRSIEELFAAARTPLRFELDRCKTVGFLRRRYPKEATVFRVELPKDRFLRADHSLDLYRGRRFVVGELSRIVGEFRDYNGGMISKQDELLATLRGELGEAGESNALLLENFFFSLTPVVMRSILPPTVLKTLFLMLLEVLDQGLMSSVGEVGFKSVEGFGLVLAVCETGRIKERLAERVSALGLRPSQLAVAQVVVHDVPCLGYIYRAGEEDEKRQFYEVIKEEIGAAEVSAV